MRRPRLAVFLAVSLALMAGLVAAEKRRTPKMRMPLTGNADQDEGLGITDDYVGSMTNGGNVRYTTWWRNLPTLAPPLPLSRDGHAFDERDERPVEVLCLDCVPGSNPAAACDCTPLCGLGEPCVCEQPCGAICINDGASGTPGPGQAPDEVGWRCDLASSGCFTCDEVASCAPACTPLANACTTTSECCTGFCREGMCTLGCLPNGSPCTLASECCVNACTGGQCAIPTTTSTSSSTSTSSTTTTSTSTLGSTTSSTSTSTSSSTSTSNTCPTTTTRPSDAAPDWAGTSTFADFVGVWHFEDCPTDGLADDSSPANNNLIQYTSRSSTAKQGVSAYAANAFGDAVICDTGATCNLDDFQFASGDFTAGLYARRTSLPGVGPIGGETEGLNTVAIFAGSGWAQTAYRLSSGETQFHLGFYMWTGSGFQTEVPSAATYPLNTYVEHAVRYTNSTGLMEQVINGLLDANTATSGPPPDPGTGNGKFGLGGFTSRGTLGQNDEGWVWTACMATQDICRIAVCDVDGAACRCSGATYLAADRHTSFGGTLTCTLPPCDQAAPRLCSASTTTSTTSTSTTTSTL